jgi:hypothetical protein
LISTNQFLVDMSCKHLDMRLVIRKRPLTIDNHDSPVKQIVENEMFNLPKRYTLQHVVERGTFGALWYVIR